MRHARVFRGKTPVDGLSSCWFASITQDRFIEVSYFPTHAEALAYALATVGLTEKNEERRHSMTTTNDMWARRWHNDMSEIARALGLDPSSIPEDDARDAILNALDSAHAARRDEETP